jgi:hypothetical protein
VRVSSGGAGALRWGHDGTLYYLSGDGERFFAAPVRTSPGLEIGTPNALFTISGRPWMDFDVTPDAQRILANVPEIAGNESPLNVVVNWSAEAAR